MLPALLGFIASVAIPVAHGATLYTTSFENPPFTTGNIGGQDGWTVFGPGLSAVEDTFALTGVQAVFVDGATTTQSGPYHTDTTTGIVDLSADIAIFTSSTQSEWQFGAVGPGGVGFLGGIDILPDDSIELISGTYTPLSTPFPRATAFDSTAWHQVDLLFNIPAQTYSFSLDGTLIASNVPFCGNNFGPCNGAAVSSYSLGLFDSFGADSTAGNVTANDSGYMDNFQVSLATPEPSTLFLFALGLAGVAAGIRRRKAA